MEIVMIITIILIGILILLLTFVWPPDSPWSPWWRTGSKTARTACDMLGISRKDVVYELGSGDGEFVLTAAKEFSAKRAVGIEIDYTRYYISKLRKQISGCKNCQFIRADFKKINLSDATVVYFYLVPAVIKRISPKLKQELKPGTKIVSYRYPAPFTLVKKKDNLYLYTM